MLEEALSSNTYSPAEAALALLSFVQVELPAGGASAEARFFRLFALLCERVFGRIAPESGYKHQLGGWLSREIKWELPPSSFAKSQKPYRSPASHLSNRSISSDPVVKLLSATNQSSSKEQMLPSLIEAFAKEAEHRPNVRYPFPFEALPKSTQESWIAILEAALGGVPFDSTSAENSSRLLGSLLRVKPLDQTQLRTYQQNKAQKKEQRRPLQLSPGYPAPTSPSIMSQSKEKDKPPSVMLSMLEYFLFIYIRYPLASPQPPDKPQTAIPSRGIQSAHRKTEHYGEAVYLHLFREYVNYFIPCRTAQGNFTGFESLSRPSELFLRIVIEFWMEGQNRLAPTSKAVESLRERKRGLVDPSSFNLNLSFDLVQGKHDPLPLQVHYCIQRLVARAAPDGAILDASRDVKSNYGNLSNAWCLTPCMSTLQLPFFNYVRMLFRRASIHALQSPFFVVLESWLLWLEPWRDPHGKSFFAAFSSFRDVLTHQRFAFDDCELPGTLRKDTTKRILESDPRSAQKSRTLPMTILKSTQRSTYDPSWEPYIAANLHLYTVPLALFLRRARELDFSPKEFDRSLKVVQNVFRVFSPPVVEALNRLLASRQAPGRFSDIVARHESNLRVYAPSKDWPLSLSACKDDMHNLLEEIHVQHFKRIRELDFFLRIASKFGGLFGQGVVSGEEKELRSLVEHAKVIVGFPKEYEVIQLSGRTMGVESQIGNFMDVTADRTFEGYLSDKGRQSLFEGTAKCNPLELTSFGDKLTGRPQSHEIAFLVPFLVEVSNYMNRKLGLVSLETSDDGEGAPSNFRLMRQAVGWPFYFRINLRLLADYRAISVVCVLCWVVQLFYR